MPPKRHDQSEGLSSLSNGYQIIKRTTGYLQGFWEKDLPGALPVAKLDFCPGQVRIE